MRRGLEDALHSVLLFVPKLLGFLIILIIGYFVAKAVSKLVDRILERVGFDRAVERGGVRTALAHSKYDASDIVAKLVYYALLLFTLQLAFGIWGPNPVSDLIRSVVAWLPNALVAIIIVVVAAAIANAVKDLIRGALGGLSYGKVLATIASVFILALGVIAALNQIGVAVTVTTPILIAVLAPSPESSSSVSAADSSSRCANAASGGSATPKPKPSASRHRPPPRPACLSAVPRLTPLSF